MDLQTGKSIRLSRLLRPTTGRGLVVAASHPILMGPIDGQRTLDEIRSLFPKLAHADAVMTTPGTLRHVVDVFRGRNAPALVIHMDWMNWYRPMYRAGGADASEGTAASISTAEELVASGVDGLMSYLYLGHRDTRLERDEVERNAKLVRECARWGLVLIIEPQPARDRVDAEARSPKAMAFYARVAAELGADIVKSDLPGTIDGFFEVTSTCPAPVLLAGGPIEDDAATLKLAKDSLTAGGRGLVFGRKIYQSPDPARLISELNDIIHGAAGRFEQP